jgi:hypothetical protein
MALQLITDEALSSAAQKLRGLIDALPELPDEVQGALAMRVPGLLDLEPQEVRARLQTLAKSLELEFEPTARLVGKVGGEEAIVMQQGKLQFCRKLGGAAETCRGDGEAVLCMRRGQLE